MLFECSSILSFSFQVLLQGILIVFADFCDVMKLMDRYNVRNGFAMTTIDQKSGRQHGG